MTTPTIECPKCGCVVPQASPNPGECAACGVVFSKFRPTESSSRPAPVPSGTYRVEARRISLAPLLVVLALLSLGALAAVSWVEGEGTQAPAAAEASKTTQPDRGPSPVEVAQARLATLPPLEGAAQRSARRPESPGVPDFRPARAANSEAPKKRWVDPDSSWFEGANGFDRGLTRARDKNQAVLVYFYADWCGYCRQLEAEILNRAVVEEYTKYLVKIKVNPEAGAAERALARTYGVTGYPSVLVHPAGLGTPKKIRGMTRKSGSWRPLATRDYVESLAAATGERFGPS